MEEEEEVEAEVLKARDDNAAAAPADDNDGVGDHGVEAAAAAAAEAPETKEGEVEVDANVDEDFEFVDSAPSSPSSLFPDEEYSVLRPADSDGANEPFIFDIAAVPRSLGEARLARAEAAIISFRFSLSF